MAGLTCLLPTSAVFEMWTSTGDALAWNGIQAERFKHFVSALSEAGGPRHDGVVYVGAEGRPATVAWARRLFLKPKPTSRSTHYEHIFGMPPAEFIKPPSAPPATAAPPRDPRTIP